MEADKVRFAHGCKQTSNGSAKRKKVPESKGPQFTIPRLKKIKRDLLTELSLDCRECQNDILAPLRKSFHFPASNFSHEFLKVQSVHNPTLVAKYLERRKDMKINGYSDTLVSDTFAFVPIENISQVDHLCKEGIKCGNQKVSGLGVPHMAVHACKHADIVAPVRSKAAEKILLMVKVIRGKVKTVVSKGTGCELEPTPNYDCHMAKPNMDQAAMQSPHLQFYLSQLYLYEYGDFDVEEYPRQVLPFAVVYFCIKEPQQVLPTAINSSPLPHSSQVVLSGSASVPGPAAGAMPWQGKLEVASCTPGLGPGNEVWRGRLHIRLIEGGHIYIEVSMLSFYVPLTVNIMSPIKIHNLFPEHNAQFTFLNGLSSLAEQAEVEWRAHYFRSFLMRARASSEYHFKALIKHISAKREMPTVRLPNDVFLFLMPNCLLASQLGLVRREDNTPVLHCVLMSKFSTSEAEKKKLTARGFPLPNYGNATSWEELFDDSDFSDEDDDEAALATRRKAQRRLAQILPIMFNDQRSIQNKFAAMSLADAEANLSPCSCRTISTSKISKQQYRDADVQRILSALQSVTKPSQKQPVTSHFPPGSRSKPKVRVSHRTRNMPSFSPHGSSDSDSDPENGHRSSRRRKGHLSLLHSTKTVEEELSEEELTNEQMEDIIFMRKKPVQNAIGLSRTKHEAVAPPKLNKQGLKKETPNTISKPKPQASPLSPLASLPSHFDTEFERRKHKEPMFLSTPKIIPTEPVEQPYSPTCSPASETGPPHAIPAGSSRSRESTPDAGLASKDVVTHPSPSPLISSDKVLERTVNLCDSSKVTKENNNSPAPPASTIKAELAETPAAVSGNCTKNSQHQEVSSTDLPTSTTVLITSTHTLQTTSISISATKTSDATEIQTGHCGHIKVTQSPQSRTEVFPKEEVDFGDVDMRVSSHRGSSLNPVFLSAKSDKSSPQKDQHSPNLSFGMWLAPSDIVAPLEPPPFPTALLPQATSPAVPEISPESPSSPCSPISLPADSPPSPTDSPASPPLESPASPPPPASPTEFDLESPLSPPQTSSFAKLRSTPIAIPTSRLEHQVASPEINYLQRQSPFPARSVNAQASPAICGSGIDNASDMKDFLNGGFNSDLDSSYEDESFQTISQILTGSKQQECGDASARSKPFSTCQASSCVEQKATSPQSPDCQACAAGLVKNSCHYHSVWYLTHSEIPPLKSRNDQSRKEQGEDPTSQGLTSRSFLDECAALEMLILKVCGNKYQQALDDVEQAVHNHQLQSESSKYHLDHCNANSANFESTVIMKTASKFKRGDTCKSLGKDDDHNTEILESIFSWTNRKPSHNHRKIVQCETIGIEDFPSISDMASWHNKFLFNATPQRMFTDIIVMPSWHDNSRGLSQCRGEKDESLVVQENVTFVNRQAPSDGQIIAGAYVQIPLPDDRGTDSGDRQLLTSQSEMTELSKDGSTSEGFALRATTDNASFNNKLSVMSEPQNIITSDPILSDSYQPIERKTTHDSTIPMESETGFHTNSDKQNTCSLHCIKPLLSCQSTNTLDHGKTLPSEATSVSKSENCFMILSPPTFSSSSDEDLIPGLNASLNGILIHSALWGKEADAPKVLKDPPNLELPSIPQDSTSNKERNIFSRFADSVCDVQHHCPLESEIEKFKEHAHWHDKQKSLSKKKMNHSVECNPINEYKTTLLNTGEKEMSLNKLSLIGQNDIGTTFETKEEVKRRKSHSTKILLNKSVPSKSSISSEKNRMTLQKKASCRHNFLTHSNIKTCNEPQIYKTETLSKNNVSPCFVRLANISTIIRKDRVCLSKLSDNSRKKFGMMSQELLPLHQNVQSTQNESVISGSFPNGGTKKFIRCQKRQQRIAEVIENLEKISEVLKTTVSSEEDSFYVSNTTVRQQHSGMHTASSSCDEIDTPSKGKGEQSLNGQQPNADITGNLPCLKQSKKSVAKKSKSKENIKSSCIPPKGYVANIDVMTNPEGKEANNKTDSDEDPFGNDGSKEFTKCHRSESKVKNGDESAVPSLNFSLMPKQQFQPRKLEKPLKKPEHLELSSPPNSQVIVKNPLTSQFSNDIQVQRKHCQEPTKEIKSHSLSKNTVSLKSSKQKKHRNDGQANPKSVQRERKKKYFPHSDRETISTKAFGQTPGRETEKLESSICQSKKTKEDDNDFEKTKPLNEKRITTESFPRMPKTDASRKKLSAHDTTKTEYTAQSKIGTHSSIQAMPSVMKKFKIPKKSGILLFDCKASSASHNSTSQSQRFNVDTVAANRSKSDTCLLDKEKPAKRLECHDASSQQDHHSKDSMGKPKSQSAESEKLVQDDTSILHFYKLSQEHGEEVLAVDEEGNGGRSKNIRTSSSHTLINDSSEVKSVKTGRLRVAPKDNTAARESNRQNPQTVVWGSGAGSNCDTPYCQAFMIQNQPYRWKQVEQIAENRKSRRGHPYSRPNQTVASYNARNYSTFDLAYRDLAELLQCMTSSTFRKAKKKRQQLDGRTMPVPGCRFFHYQFVRSTLPNKEQEAIECESLIRPEDIKDFEVRRQMADMVEELAEQSMSEVMMPTAIGNAEEGSPEEFIVLDETFAAAVDSPSIFSDAASTPERLVKQVSRKSSALSGRNIVVTDSSDQQTQPSLFHNLEKGSHGEALPQLIKKEGNNFPAIAQTRSFGQNNLDITENKVEGQFTNFIDFADEQNIKTEEQCKKLPSPLETSEILELRNTFVRDRYTITTADEIQVRLQEQHKNDTPSRSVSLPDVFQPDILFQPHTSKFVNQSHLASYKKKPDTPLCPMSRSCAPQIVRAPSQKSYLHTRQEVCSKSQTSQSQTSQSLVTQENAWPQVNSSPVFLSDSTPQHPNDQFFIGNEPNEQMPNVASLQQYNWQEASCDHQKIPSVSYFDEGFCQSLFSAKPMQIQQHLPASSVGEHCQDTEQPGDTSFEIDPVSTFLPHPAQYSHDRSLSQEEIIEHASINTPQKSPSADCITDIVSTLDSLQTWFSNRLAASDPETSTKVDDKTSDKVTTTCPTRTSLPQKSTSNLQLKISQEPFTFSKKGFCRNNHANYSQPHQSKSSLSQTNAAIKDQIGNNGIEATNRGSGKINNSTNSLTASPPPPPPPPLPPSVLSKPSTQKASAKLKGHRKKPKNGKIRTVGPHPLRHEKWDKVPQKITFEKHRRVYLPNPDLKKQNFCVLEFSTYPSRDPRLRAPSKRKRCEKEKNSLLPGSSSTIRIVKDIPLEPTEKRKQNLAIDNSECVRTEEEVTESRNGQSLKMKDPAYSKEMKGLKHNDTAISHLFDSRTSLESSQSSGKNAIMSEKEESRVIVSLANDSIIEKDLHIHDGRNKSSSAGTKSRSFQEMPDRDELAYPADKKEELLVNICQTIDGVMQKDVHIHDAGNTNSSEATESRSFQDMSEEDELANPGRSVVSEKEESCVNFRQTKDSIMQKDEHTSVDEMNTSSSGITKSKSFQEISKQDKLANFAEHNESSIMYDARNPSSFDVAKSRSLQEMLKNDKPESESSMSTLIRESVSVSNKPTSTSNDSKYNTHFSIQENIDLKNSDLKAKTITRVLSYDVALGESRADVNISDSLYEPDLNLAKPNHLTLTSEHLRIFYEQETEDSTNAKEMAALYKDLESEANGLNQFDISKMTQKAFEEAEKAQDVNEKSLEDFNKEVKHEIGLCIGMQQVKSDGELSSSSLDSVAMSPPVHNFNGKKKCSSSHSISETVEITHSPFRSQHHRKPATKPKLKDSSPICPNYIAQHSYMHKLKHQVLTENLDSTLDPLVMKDGLKLVAADTEQMSPPSKYLRKHSHAIPDVIVLDDVSSDSDLQCKSIHSKFHRKSISPGRIVSRLLPMYEKPRSSRARTRRSTPRAYRRSRLSKVHTRSRSSSKRKSESNSPFSEKSSRSTSPHFQSRSGPQVMSPSSKFLCKSPNAKPDVIILDEVSSDSDLQWESSFSKFHKKSPGRIVSRSLQICEKPRSSRSRSPKAHRRPRAHMRSRSPRIHTRLSSPREYTILSSPRAHRRSRSPRVHRRSSSPRVQRRSRSPRIHTRLSSPRKHRRSRSPRAHRRSRSHTRSRSPRAHRRSRSHTRSRSPRAHRRSRSHTRSRSPRAYRRSRSHTRSRSPRAHRRSSSPRAYTRPRAHARSRSHSKLSSPREHRRSRSLRSRSPHYNGKSKSRSPYSKKNSRSRRPYFQTESRSGSPQMSPASKFLCKTPNVKADMNIFDYVTSDSNSERESKSCRELILPKSSTKSKSLERIVSRSLQICEKPRSSRAFSRPSSPRAYGISRSPEMPSWSRLNSPYYKRVLGSNSTYSEINLRSGSPHFQAESRSRSPHSKKETHLRSLNVFNESKSKSPGFERRSKSPTTFRDTGSFYLLQKALKESIYQQPSNKPCKNEQLYKNDALPLQSYNAKQSSIGYSSRPNDIRWHDHSPVKQVSKSEKCLKLDRNKFSLSSPTMLSQNDNPGPFTSRCWQRQKSNFPHHESWPPTQSSKDHSPQRIENKTKETHEHFSHLQGSLHSRRDSVPEKQRERMVWKGQSASELYVNGGLYSVKSDEYKAKLIEKSLSTEDLRPQKGNCQKSELGGKRRHLTDPIYRFDQNSHTVEKSSERNEKLHSGAIAAATEMLLNPKPLATLLDLLVDKKKAGTPWHLEVHIKSVCDMDDKRRVCLPNSLEFLEIERCKSLINKYQLEGVVKLVQTCECRKNRDWSLSSTVKCLMSRKKQGATTILLCGDLSKTEEFDLKVECPDLIVSNMNNIVSMLQ